MSLREQIQRQKAWLLPTVLVAALGGVVYAVWHTKAQQALAPEVTHAYFSEDDGKTYFTDSIERPSPFDHSGKQAYRAFVFRYGTDKPFVALIGKYERPGSPIEVRKPGTTNWFPMGNGSPLNDIKCPNGDPAEAILPDAPPED